MGDLHEDLAAAFTELRQTHISWVFLGERDVYKVKKPVDFGFLDFTTPDRRRAACMAEVDLNRRLAPDVYRGVVPVTRGADGVHRIGGDGDVVDWAVHMRRLSDRDRADVRLARGEITTADVDRMAVHLAAFHAGCDSSEDKFAFGRLDAIEANVRENFDQTRATIGEFVSRSEAAEIERWQLSFLDDHRALFERRVQELRIRDGHGDLRLEHFYLEGASHEDLRVIDCIEFSERFRYADVCADLSFLSMDLAWHGRVDLAERLLATYARETCDYDLFSLVDFYESYRAYVRGKVATFLAADACAPAALRARSRKDARRYYLLALACERRSLMPPCVVAIGGLLATGKSTLADRLGAVLGAPAINTDRVRKHLLGARPTDKLYDGSWQGAYDPRFSEDVYRAVYRSARVVLESGRPVILDASFRSRALRARARDLAEAAGVPFRFVECVADHDLLRERLRRRATETSVSDGRIEIFDDFVAKWEPIDELPEDEHVVLDTSVSVERSLTALAERLPVWPPGLTA